MRIFATIIGGLSVITTALGVISILDFTDPILSAKLTWQFWFAASVILLLGSITVFIGYRDNVE